MRITILGAGDMGTALATPTAANGHDVRLWGTAYDGAIVAALRAGAPHPRLGSTLPASVRVCGHAALDAALDGAELVVLGVTSYAIAPVLDEIGDRLRGARAILTVAKGFDEDGAGTIRPLTDLIAERVPAPVVGIGGPSKANEVATGRPTAVVFASPDAAILRVCHDAFETPAYRVATTPDLVGVEVAAAMKNAYAIALGIADGLQVATGLPHHNLRAALFPLAIREMSRLAEAMGGRTETVAGLAGAGDLQVTITAGRNRVLGELIGRGTPAEEAVRSLASADTTIEGYAAAMAGHRLARSLAGKGGVGAEYPLLHALHAVLAERAPVSETLWAAVG